MTSNPSHAGECSVSATLLPPPPAAGNHPAEDGPAQACRNVHEDHPHTRQNRTSPGRRISRVERSRPVILQGMEPGLAHRGPDRVIFLNGASHSGKSTLAKAMQQALAEPFLHLSSDHLVASGMLPVRRDPDGPFAWRDQMRPRLFARVPRGLPALA